MTQRDARPEISPRKVAGRLKQEGKHRLERGKTSAAEQVEQVASALKSAGNQLGSQSTLGNYAHQFADGVSRFGSRLRDGRIEELVSDVQTFARRNPTLFIVGGLALGVVLARVVKASAAPDDRDYEDASSSSYASEAGESSYDGEPHGSPRGLEG